MTISPPEREEKKTRVIVDNNPVPTSFEKWAKPGHFDRSLTKWSKNHNLDLEPRCPRPRF